MFRIYDTNTVLREIRDREHKTRETRVTLDRIQTRYDVPNATEMIQKLQDSVSITRSFQGLDWDESRVCYRRDWRIDFRKSILDYDSMGPLRRASGINSP